MAKKVGRPSNRYTVQTELPRELKEKFEEWCDRIGGLSNADGLRVIITEKVNEMEEMNRGRSEYLSHPSVNHDER